MCIWRCHLGCLLEIIVKDINYYNFNDGDGGVCAGEYGDGAVCGGDLRLIFLDQNLALSSVSHIRLSGNGCHALFWLCDASCATQYARVCCEATDASRVHPPFSKHFDSIPERGNHVNVCNDARECGRVRPMNDDDV